MSEEDVSQVKTRSVGCNGGGGPLGHPLVYLRIGAEGKVTCPYCSKTYALAPDAAVAAESH